MLDPGLSLSGLVVGMLVGLTGVGGGALMTPLLILVFGIGGMQFGDGQFALQGVSLAALIGIALNLVLPRASEDE